MESTKTQTSEPNQFWENLYQTGKTPWDLGRPAPALASFLDSPYTIPPGRVAVLGCGTGNDCVLFAQRGFEVTAVDFAPSAIARTVQKFTEAGVLGTNGFLLERDLFQMHDYDHYYDYVLEHCTFCAIEPSRRQTYMWTVRDLLVPGGKFIALWWLVPPRAGGPPFSVQKDDIFEVCDKVFDIELAYEPQNSPKERAGQEFLTVMTTK